MRHQRDDPGLVCENNSAPAPVATLVRVKGGMPRMPNGFKVEIDKVRWRIRV
ncbi:hypothetical protein ACVWWG_000326 [Bradyrhizobium sp. LB7.2]